MGVASFPILSVAVAPIPEALVLGYYSGEMMRGLGSVVSLDF